MWTKSVCHLGATELMVSVQAELLFSVHGSDREKQKGNKERQRGEDEDEMKSALWGSVISALFSGACCHSSCSFSSCHHFVTFLPLWHYSQQQHQKSGKQNDGDRKKVFSFQAAELCRKGDGGMKAGVCVWTDRWTQWERVHAARKSWCDLISGELREDGCMFAH